MPRPSLKLYPHLSVEELAQRYRTCRDAGEKTRWQTLWLYAQHPSPSYVAQHTGFSRHWVYQLVRRYNQEGPQSLRDGRYDNQSGRQRAILSPEEQQALWQALQQRPADGGLWTAAKVAHWVKAHTGKVMAEITAWTYLQRLGFSLQRPRPRHTQAASPQVEAAFKKK
jgi:transposase